MKKITTFPCSSEWEKARSFMDSQRLPYEVIQPAPGYQRVGVPALVVEDDVRRALYTQGSDESYCCGWVDYQPSSHAIPASAPPQYADDIFGATAIVTLQACLADETKIRIIANISGNLAEAFPYLNAQMPGAYYNVDGPSFTFMEGYRRVVLYPQRIAIAKADEIVDVWRVLELLRVRFNEAWLHRQEITPNYVLRQKPAVLAIYQRLPKTNCGECGEKTCMAFAVKLWSGLISHLQCKPVFSGNYGHLKDSLFEISAGLGMPEEGKIV